MAIELHKYPTLDEVLGELTTGQLTELAGHLLEMNRLVVGDATTVEELLAFNETDLPRFVAHLFIKTWFDHVDAEYVSRETTAPDDLSGIDDDA